MRALLIALLLACLSPCAAGASIITFGSNLDATPTLDTANGAFSNSGSTKGSGPTVIAPNPHEAEDTGIWNTALASGDPAAPQGGQALEITVKGCAIEASTAPSQLSDGTPANTILFQTLTPNADGTYTATATSGEFQLPFCSPPTTNGELSPSDTVTTFTPVHQCLSQGSLVAFHDIGGFIPYDASTNTGPWYPQGVPFEVIAAVPGSSIDSFVGVGLSTYGPGIYGPDDNHAVSGFGIEGGEELMLQVEEGTGGDAYGLCPGGKQCQAATTNAPVPCAGAGNTGGSGPGSGSGGSGSGSGGSGSGDSGSGGSGSGSSGSGSAGSGTHAGSSGSTAGPPKISSVALSPVAFRANGHATLTYVDSLAASARLRIVAGAAGVLVRDACVPKPAHSSTRLRGCTRLVQFASFTHNDIAGRNSARIVDHRLKPGRYELQVVATRAGHSSVPVSVAFRVLAS